MKVKPKTHRLIEPQSLGYSPTVPTTCFPLPPMTATKTQTKLCLKGLFFQLGHKCMFSSLTTIWNTLEAPTILSHHWPSWYSACSQIAEEKAALAWGPEKTTVLGCSGANENVSMWVRF